MLLLQLPVLSPNWTAAHLLKRAATVTDGPGRSVFASALKVDRLWLIQHLAVRSALLQIKIMIVLSSNFQLVVQHFHHITNFYHFF